MERGGVTATANSLAAREIESHFGMGKRILLIVIGVGLILAGWISLARLFGALNWFDDVPFPPRPWAWFVAAQAGMGTLGAAALAAAILARLRRPWFVGIAVLAAIGVSVLRFPQVYPTVAFSSLHRMSYWRNGSELFLASPEYLAWADEFADWLRARPDQKRLTYSVFVRMGDYHLRVGNTTPAISYFEKALTSLEANRAEIERENLAAYKKKRQEVLRWMITAHLRAGERENCIRQTHQEACIFPLRGGGLWSLDQPALEAQRWAREFLAGDPDNPGVRYLLNVAPMAAAT